MVAYADNPKSSAQKLRTILSGGLKDFKSSLSKKALPSDLAQEIVVAISRELEKFLTDMHVETCDQVSGRIQKKINSLDPVKVFFTDDVMAKLKETFADDEYRQSILDVLQGINPDAKIEDVKAKASGKAAGESENTKEGGKDDESKDEGFQYDEKQFAEFLDKVLPKVKFFDDIILKLSDQITESLKDIKVVSDELIKSNHKLAVSNLQLAASNIALKAANLSLAAANLQLAASNIALSVSNITLAISNVALSVSNFVLAAAKLVLAASNIVLAVANIALAITVITATISLMVTVITAMVAVIVTVFSAAAAVVATVFAATLSVVVAIAGLIISAAGVALSIVGLALSIFASAAVIAVAVLAAAALLAIAAVVVGGALIVTALVVGSMIAITAIAIGGALIITAIAIGGALVIAAGLIALATIAVAGTIALVAIGLVAVAVALAFGVAAMLAGAILAVGVLLAGTALIIAAMMMVVLLPISIAVALIMAVVVGIVALLIFGFLLAKDKIEEMIKWVTDWWEKSWFKQQIDEIQQVGLWEWFKQKLENTWKWITDMAGAFSDWWKTTDLYKWWNSENKWGQLWDAICDGLKKAFSWMVSFGEWLTNFGKKICDAFVDWWKNSDLKKGWDRFTKWFDEFSISKMISGIWDGIKEKFKAVFKPLASFSVTIPTIDTHDSINPFKWDFGTKQWQPFAGLLDDGTESKVIESVSAAPELGQTLNSIDNGEQEGKQELANTTREVKTQMDEETAAQQFKEDGRFKTMLDMMGELNAGMAQRNKTEYVPAPIVVQGGGELAWENR